MLTDKTIVKNQVSNHQILLMKSYLYFLLSFIKGKNLLNFTSHLIFHKALLLPNHHALF